MSQGAFVGVVRFRFGAPRGLLLEYQEKTLRGQTESTEKLSSAVLGRDPQASRISVLQQGVLQGAQGCDRINKELMMKLSD